MAVKAVVSVRASWAQTLNGVAFAKDQALTGAQARAIRHLDAYLSSGQLYTVGDRYGRKGGSKQYRPTALDPATLRAL